MALDLERPPLTNENFWQKLIAELDFDKDQISQIESFKKFIQAPDNGFLILDVLDKFIETCAYLSDTETHLLLNPYIELAKTLKIHFRNVFFKAKSDRQVFHNCNSENAHLCLDCFMKVVAAHNNIELFPIDVQSFIESKLFKNYKRFAFIKKHPIYVTLFFPHVAQNSSEDVVEAAEILQRIKAVSLNLLVQLKRELKEGSGSQYEYIYETVYFKKTIPIKPETLNEYLYKGITKSASSHYVDPIINHGFNSVVAPVDLIKLINVQIDYAEDIKTDFKALLELTKTFTSIHNDLENFITNFTELRRFFNHFTNSESEEHSNADEREVSKNRNLKLGIVSIDEFIKSGINPNEVTFDNGLKAKLVELYDIKVDGRTGDSTRETLIAAPSDECKTNSPVVKVMTAKSRNHHLALNNQQLIDSSNPQILKSVFDELENKARLALQDQDKQISQGLVLAYLLLVCGRVLNNVKLIDEYDPNFDYRAPCISRDLKFLVLPIDIHVYKSNADRNVYVQNTGRHLVLHLPDISEKSVLKLWNEYQAEFNPKVLSFNIKPIIGNVGEVQKLIQNLYRKQIDDDWFVALITDKKISIVNTIKHYASISEEKIQECINQHLSVFLESVEFYESKSLKRVGSLYYPNEQVLKAQFNAIRRLINLGIRKLETDVLPTNMMIPWWNLFSFYTDSMIAYSVGTRNVTDPFVLPEKLLSTGWTLIDDKNQYSGYNTREVFLPKAVVEQIDIYRKLKSVVFNKFTDRGVCPGLNHVIKKEDKTNVKFNEFKMNKMLKGFLAQNELLILQPIAHPLGKTEQKSILPTSYTRQYMQNILKEVFKYFRTAPQFNIRNLKTNTNRHYLRGKLLELNVNPLYINSLLGHWHIGQEPWSYRLLFNQEQYHQQIEKAIPQLLRDIGLDKPIKFTGLPDYKKKKNHEE